MSSLIYYITGVITGAGALSAWRQWQQIMLRRRLEIALLGALHEHLAEQNLAEKRTESDPSDGPAPN